MTDEETVTPTVVLTAQPPPSVAAAILGKVLQTDGNGLQTVMVLYENRHVRLKANQGWVPLKRRERERKEERPWSQRKGEDFRDEAQATKKESWFR